MKQQRGWLCVKDKACKAYHGWYFSHCSWRFSIKTIGLSKIVVRYPNHVEHTFAHGTGFLTLALTFSLTYMVFPLTSAGAGRVCRRKYSRQIVFGSEGRCPWDTAEEWGKPGLGPCKLVAGGAGAGRWVWCDSRSARSSPDSRTYHRCQLCVGGKSLSQGARQQPKWATLKVFLESVWVFS